MKKITLFMLIFFTISSQGQNKLQSSITEYYNGGTYENGYATNYEYDSNNNLITEIGLGWDWESSVWRINEKVTYKYNADNKVIEEMGQYLNNNTKKLENEYRDTYIYTNGYFSGQVWEYWDGSSWVIEGKNEITYNPSNLPVSALSYEWKGSWVVQSRETLAYNGNKISTDISENWTGSGWVNYYKSLYAYDVNNKISSNRSADWDDFNALWKETNRIDYVLDSFGNRISDIETRQDNNKYKNEYTYDMSSSMSSFAHPFKDKNGLDYLTEDLPYINKILVSKFYSLDNGIYRENNRTTYNYNSAVAFSALSVEQPEIAAVSITVFPNPTASVVNLNFSNNVVIDKVVVTDISGKTVLEQNQNTAKINVEKLAIGLYILEAYSGNEKFTTKFVKK